MRLLKVLILCFLLSACVFGTTQNSKFYTLTAQKTEPLSNKNLNFIGVNRIQLPKYMDRPQIVTQSLDSNEMTVSEYNRWIESPAVLVSRILTEDLSNLLPKTQIKINPFGTEKFDKIVSVEIIKMDAILGGKAELEAWYTIKNNSGKVLTRQKFSDSVKIGNSYDDLAVGYSNLLMNLSKQIGQSLI